MTTHAITIARPAALVWPWLVQMGYQRGGWYSYDWLKRAIGIGDFADGGSARRILPDLRPLVPGDGVDLSPNGGFTVVSLEPEKSLVLHVPMDPTEHGCRLIIRVRGDLRPRWLALTFLLLDPVDLVMERKMLQTIQLRAESVNLA